MPKYWRELDHTIEELTDFFMQTRGRAGTSLSSEERLKLKRLVVQIENFASSVGLFLTDDLALVEGVFEELLLGYRAYVTSKLWKGLGRVLVQVGRYTRDRGVTPSGRLFVEMRRRLAIAIAAGAGTGCKTGAAALSQRLRRYRFGGSFSPDLCSLRDPTNRAKRLREVVVSCALGCDLGLLWDFGFHPEIVARLAGLKKDTTENRWLACQECIRRRALEAAPSLVTSSSHAR